MLQSLIWQARATATRTGRTSRCRAPAAPSTTTRLYELYAYPADAAACWVRGNVITSLDGGATTDGTSGGLGGTGDRALFNVLRELADVVVVGAGTARAENYSGAQMTVAAAPQPPAARPEPRSRPSPW